MAYNEHCLNMQHQHNSVGFSGLLGGGETDVCSVVAHNGHKNVGRIQEGGTSLLTFGPLAENLDGGEDMKDESGLGRWSVMTTKGGDRTVTRIICGYNPCGNNKPNSNTVYQQHRQYFITQKQSLVCPKVQFWVDLVAALIKRRE